MRLIDADELIQHTYSAVIDGVETDIIDVSDVDNAPTVEPCYQTTSCLDCGNYDKENHNCPRYCEVIKEAINSRPQGEWIPVSERLPNCNGVYNVTRKLNEGETIYFISDASYFDGQNTWHADTGINHGRPYLTDIIAWQPLPEPYKKGGAEMIGGKS